MATTHNEKQTIQSSTELAQGDSWVDINSAGSSGGALSLSGAITVDGSENQFLRNLAKYGGAINFGKAVLNVTDCVFSGNSATSLGGAFFVNDSGSLRMTGGSLTNNYAAGVGSVGYFSKGGGTFTNVYASGNISSDGVFYMEGSGALQIDGGTYTGNRSSNGGVIYNKNSSSISKADGAVFSGNTATNNGGVVFNGASATLPASTFSGSTFPATPPQTTAAYFTTMQER